VAREEGLVGLYGGLVPHMLRVVPSAVIMFGTYEFVLKSFGVNSNVIVAGKDFGNANSTKVDKS
jgi:solute carrier family 25 protein 33/36